MEKIFTLLLDWIFPRRCPVCGDVVRGSGKWICPDCYRKLSFVQQPVCKKCGKELVSDREEYCPDCQKHKRSFEYGRALLNYDEVTKRSLAAVKYHNKREYLDFYARVTAARYEKVIRRMDADLLVPVPVHTSRRRQRGFNQAEELAVRLGRLLNMPVDAGCLVRTRKTAPQKKLTAAQRLKNLEAAFQVGKLPENVKSVILIDDIYTTGSTIEACTRVLKRAGVERVYFLTVCIGRG